MSIEQEIIKAYPDQLPSKIFEYDNVEEIREWFKTHGYIWPYYKLKEKIVSKGIEYRATFPVNGKYKIENREYTLEDDKELEMFHFRLYDDYGRLFGVILLYAEEISEKQQKKIDAAKEAGIRISVSRTHPAEVLRDNEELINELEMWNLKEC